MLTAAERNRFDAIFESVLKTIPRPLQNLIETVPVIIEDQPSAGMMQELEVDIDDLCGVHTGIPLTERSVEDFGDTEDTIHLFRRGIVACAGGWDSDDLDIASEIKITLLHEIGHHFGLDEHALHSIGLG